MATIQTARKTISTLLKNINDKNNVIEEYTHQTKIIEIWQLISTRTRNIIVIYEFTIPNEVDRIRVYFESHHDNLQSIIAELIHKGEYVPDDPIKIKHVTKTYKESRWTPGEFIYDVCVVSFFMFCVLGVVTLFLIGLYFIFHLIMML